MSGSNDQSGQGSRSSSSHEWVKAGESARGNPSPLPKPSKNAASVSKKAASVDNVQMGGGGARGYDKDAPSPSYNAHIGKGQHR